MFCRTAFTGPEQLQSAAKREADGVGPHRDRELQDGTTIGALADIARAVQSR